MKKQLLCPQCGRRLMDTETSVKSETRVMDSLKMPFWRNGFRTII